MWKKAYAKAKGASVILNMHLKQNASIFSGGYGKKENMKSWAELVKDIQRVKLIT